MSLSYVKSSKLHLDNFDNFLKITRELQDCTTTDSCFLHLSRKSASLFLPDRQTDRQIARQAGGQMDNRTYRQIARQAGKQVDNRTYRQIDRQTDRPLYLHLTKSVHRQHTTFLHTFVLHHHRYSPVGIFSLTAAKMAEIDNFHTIFKSISFYFLTVCIGLSFHAFITLPLIYFTLTRKNPINMLRSVTEALSFAFGTSSRLATGSSQFTHLC